MIERGQNNLSARDFEEADQLDDEFIPDDARPVCVKCLEPCHPLQHYCANCDSNAVINPLTPYMPFLNIRFNYGGFCIMWRKIWYDKDTSIKRQWFYLFMIIAFAPIMLVLGLPFSKTAKIKNTQLRRTTIIVLYVLAFVLLMFFSILANFSLISRGYQDAF